MSFYMIMLHGNFQGYNELITTKRAMDHFHDSCVTVFQSDIFVSLNCLKLVTYKLKLDPCENGGRKGLLYPPKYYARRRIGGMS